MNRRNFIIFLGAIAGTQAIAACKTQVTSGSSLPKALPVHFKPVPGPLPLMTDTVAEAIATFEVTDDLLLPEGYEYDILGSWGDKLGASRFGYNNDYLAFVETAPNEGYLSINFEYISAGTWLQTHEAVTGKKLPLEVVTKALSTQKDGLDAYSLKDSDPLKQQINAICREAMIDQGLGIISLRKTANGKWERTFSKNDRRVTGISGLDDNNHLRCTGPAKTVFRKTSGLGYIDKLGDKIIGTFGNCAGGLTPWGTVLSAEENIQVQVPDAVHADGTSFEPKAMTFAIGDEELSGQGNVFGLCGNKYGWIVEIDPANPADYGTKHSWLGRYRHEAVGIRVVTGKPLAFYSGCDRRGGHIYKFVSKDAVKNPKDKANSKLMENGMLYAAKINADGTGEWIALESKTAINPQKPSDLVGGMINLPDRPKGGYRPVKDDSEVAKYKQQYKTLGDLYQGSPEEKQGAILIDAHYAANACGATCTARPEDTEIAPDGSLYIAFTSGSPSKSDGSPDKTVFKGPKGETPYEYGFVMHLIEDKNDPAAKTFTWKMMALGGDPATGGAGFSNPDNLMLDPKGNLWIVTDVSSDKMNKPSKDDQRGIFGNNTLWFMPTLGENAGQAYRFAIAPMEAELTGPFLTPDQSTLFLSIQHPGETHGQRKDMKTKTETFNLTANGKTFDQTRQIPVGSNFPERKPNSVPNPRSWPSVKRAARSSRDKPSAP
ncbi:MAG: DUF839 domain-containing protein [Alkalinema sp. RU_4_3]|nr:DUF839 domain-containing protein [Alkalinema sp. RU_4_3]